ncbi:PREDICTED: galactose-specific lectin nattectin-like isoform X1 [Cyprinodon variegatus]|uniref:galactose-specific lectin nattectin-like isoform X1 n=1 Tax=Cyprinodon variegatus TaxID=28743 RepID=UPI0007428A98|nr:PREDICTED: galactose-specific lectin nattectin-like isoform X1 [Cyprinodon variegatus]
MRHPEGCEEAEAAASQHENPTRTSKLPSVRVVLLVLGSLLAAALIIIYRLSVVWMSNRDVQILKEENEDLRTFFSGGDDISLAGASGEGENLEEELTPPECEAGWELHGGNCYYFSNYKSSWTESRDSCRGQGGDLVKIDSREEQMFLVGRLNNLIVDESDKFWIGLTKAEIYNWFWVDGSTLDERFD